ncbi:MAG: helix-turn-helix transcriptional regulator [Pseudomonadota bacterium]
MSSDYQWIFDALARDRTKTQAGLAEAMHVHKSAITQLKKGNRQLKLKEAQAAERYLGVAAPSGFAEPGTGGYEAEPPRTSQPAPIYAAEATKNGYWRLDRTNAPLDYRRPGANGDAPGAVFGFFAPDDAMAPRFKMGEAVWVDAVKPASSGHDALLIEKKNAGQARPEQKRHGPERVMLCVLVAAEQDVFRVMQHGGDATIELSRKDWMALHVLPRA